jgi:hypothetical protein
MAERDNQRGNRRADASCQSDVNVPPRQNPPLRASKDCDPVATPPDPDTFSSPTTCPAPAAPLLVVPDPLVIGNDAQSAECPLGDDKPGTVGSPVTIDADTFTDTFNFGAIEGINANQLTFLAGLDNGQRATLADPDTTISVIAAITHLSITQATFINEQVVALKASVDAIAQAAAEGQLVCLFFNTAQEITCTEAGFPANAYTNENAPAGEEENVNNPSSINADLYSSPDSQEEADEIAANVARSGLKCYYGNDEVTVDCESVGYAEEVPTDESPVSADGRLRVGSVTIEADTIFSGASRAVATALAQTLAESQLVCFYLNSDLILTCESIGKQGTAAPVARVATGQSGNPVFVPAGFVQSTTSTADANARALILAQGLLDCYWVNSKQCKTCPVTEVTNPDDPDGPPFYVTAQDAGPRCIPAGSLRSYVSKADANAQADILAEAQLICIYCNPTIYPKCAAPDWSGTIPVPPEEIDNTWAVTATRGVAAGTICSTQATDVIGIAVSIGNTPADISNASDCCYGNLEVSAACENDIDDNAPDPELSSGEVTIAAGTLVVCDSDAAAAGWTGTTQEYATQLAQQLASAAIVCIWSNSEQTESCDLPGGDDVVIGASTVTVEAGLFVSFRSKAEADSIASTVARSQLNCLYCNPGGENGSGSACAIGDIYLGQPTMEECSFISAVSSAAAAALANVVSDSMAVCVSPDDMAMFAGEPGNDGAQTGCSGNCYGYYS